MFSLLSVAPELVSADSVRSLPSAAVCGPAPSSRSSRGAWGGHASWGSPPVGRASVPVSTSAQMACAVRGELAQEARHLHSHPLAAQVRPMPQRMRLASC